MLAAARPYLRRSGSVILRRRSRFPPMSSGFGLDHAFLDGLIDGL
jgi:hypothetical protein